jgi:hypothetical protein
MTDLRTAAQLALEAMDKATRYMSFSDHRKLNEAITALRAALEQPEQEPVAWQWLNTAHFRQKLPVDAEPGAWTPLFIHPPQRKPLAEWQINDLMANIDPEDVCSWSFRQGVYAAEKHHGVKP